MAIAIIVGMILFIALIDYACVRAKSQISRLEEKENEKNV